MKLNNLIKTCILCLAFIAPLAACDGGDEETSTSAEGNVETEESESEESSDTAPTEDVTCAIYCVQYIESCLGTEFNNDAECQAACEPWDQEGKNCRYEQMIGGMCDQAGNTGDAC